MSKQVQNFFLEDWLKSNISINKSTKTLEPTSSSSSARAIIQSWANLRNSLQNQTFQTHHLQSLQTLLSSQTSINVADPQAKILLSLISSPNLSLPPESHPFFLKLLYIWLRKSSKPSPSLVESTVPILTNLLSTKFSAEIHSSIVSHGVLLLGAISSVPVLSENSKRVCLELLCKLLGEECRNMVSFEEFVPEVLAGIGYALISSEIAYFSKILGCMFGIWGKEGSPSGLLCHGLMILHLIEWVVSGFANIHSFQKIEFLCQEISRTHMSNSVLFAVVMAAAGALRGLNKAPLYGTRAEIVHQIRISLEECIEAVARDLISKTGNFCNLIEPNNRFLLQCISLSFVRSGPLSFRPPLLSCLISALLIEVFPLRSFYTRILDSLHENFAQLGLNEVKEHLDSILFKEAGAITRVFCNQYISADEENKAMVENLMWRYCQDIYSGHRQIALVLQGGGMELFADLEKITESSFLMVVVFASVVTKNRFTSAICRETQLEVSVNVLVSFSCVEYFRRIRLPEYTDAIRGVAKNVQENDSACVSFIESMPSYAELTNSDGMICSYSHFQAFQLGFLARNSRGTSE
ncbi:hypothetical protein BVC80_8973g40 [Macleaya cordata]|uniref:Armadillo-like helical n=1 Tax=Macleaya cordata TaxID=56857 RepID=A0A200PMR4_MACCD|nr:hypothetical protein BVC80_8973g40 [Macleaya cordata]